MAICKKEVNKVSINDREFCIVLRPGFCSRRLTLVGTKYCNSIQDVQFICDEVLLIQFKSGLRLKFYYNGVMMPLDSREVAILRDPEVPDSIVTESSFRYKKEKHLLF